MRTDQYNTIKKKIKKKSGIEQNFIENNYMSEMNKLNGIPKFQRACISHAQSLSNHTHEKITLRIVLLQL